MNKILLILLISLLICFFYVLNKKYEKFSNASYSNKKICIIQYDDRELDEKLSHLKNLNKTYCKLHNIDYRFYNKVNVDLPPYWIKVYLVQKLLPSFDYVMWIDTDAYLGNVHNLNQFIQRHIEDKDFLLSSDMPPWVTHSPFNAGVFVVKNSEIGNNLINKWMSKFRPYKWKKNKSNKWVCIGNSCNWAGKNYEQGSFTKYIMPKYRPHIKEVSWSIINNPFYDKAKNCIFHFAAEHKKNIEISKISL